jgi:uncharacterized protein YydD (DUF2326 family)
MSLEAAEVAARVTGAGAKQVAVMLYAIMKDQKKTRGKMRLTNMLKSGKELKVFAVKDKDLTRFCTEAKKYGVLYCVLRDRDANDGITDVMIRAEDVSKVNRIFERFNLSTVDMASIKSELLKVKERAAEANPENPKEARAKTDPQSGLSLEARNGSEPDRSGKRSVREELKELRQIVKERADIDFPGRVDSPIPKKVKEVR